MCKLRPQEWVCNERTLRTGVSEKIKPSLRLDISLTDHRRSRVVFVLTKFERTVRACETKSEGIVAWKLTRCTSRSLGDFCHISYVSRSQQLAKPGENPLARPVLKVEGLDSRVLATPSPRLTTPETAFGEKGVLLLASTIQTHS